MNNLHPIFQGLMEPMRPPLTSKELCERTGLSRATVNKRLREGWTEARILETPAMSARQRGLASKAAGPWNVVGHYRSGK